MGVCSSFVYHVFNKSNLRLIVQAISQQIGKTQTTRLQLWCPWRRQTFKQQDIAMRGEDTHWSQGIILRLEGCEVSGKLPGRGDI